MKLKPSALALSAGIFWGLCVLIGTWWILIFGTGGQTFRLLGNFYFGYSVTFLGSLIGLVWGFVDGLICGFIFAWLYNLFVKEKATT